MTEAMAAEFPELEGLVGLKYESLRTIKPGKNADDTGLTRTSLNKQKLSRSSLKFYTLAALLSMHLTIRKITTLRRPTPLLLHV